MGILRNFRGVKSACVPLFHTWDTKSHYIELVNTRNTSIHDGLQPFKLFNIYIYVYIH